MKNRDKVLLVVSELPSAYGSVIWQKLEEALPPSKLFPNSKLWDTIRSPSIGMIYVCLEYLEENGFLTSEWSEERFADRGHRRRRHYYLTEQGKERVAELKSQPLVQS